MNFEFDLLNRELQQAVPLPRILAHLDKLLSLLSLEDFQTTFAGHVTVNRIDRTLLMKVYRHLLNRFDRIHCGGKYALNDDFVNLFNTSRGEMSGKCDRFYEFAKDTLPIHIRASESLVCDGTTGYSLWDASIALLAILETSSHPLRFEGKRVLELGSGTGLGGLAVAACSNPTSVLLTDVAQVHDAFTLPNTLLNPHLNPKISTEIVYWNDLTVDPVPYASNYEIILGCDLVYDPDVVCMLSDALNSLLLCPSSTISTAVLLCTLRNPQTFDDFIAALNNEQRYAVQIEMIDYDSESNPIILQSIESFRMVTISKQ